MFKTFNELLISEKLLPEQIVLIDSEAQTSVMLNVFEEKLKKLLIDVIKIALQQLLNKKYLHLSIVLHLFPVIRYQPIDLLLLTLIVLVVLMQ